MLTFGITIPNFIVIFGIRISFVLRQSESCVILMHTLEKQNEPRPLLKKAEDMTHDYP